MSEQTQTSVPRKEYTLKAPLIQGRDEKEAGDKVMLRADQAKRLKDILA